MEVALLVITLACFFVILFLLLFACGFVSGVWFDFPVLWVFGLDFNFLRCLTCVWGCFDISILFVLISLLCLLMMLEFGVLSLFLFARSLGFSLHY